MQNVVAIQDFLPLLILLHRLHTRKRGILSRNAIEA
jgi:hypothetical protein